MTTEDTTEKAAELEPTGEEQAGTTAAPVDAPAEAEAKAAPRKRAPRTRRKAVEPEGPAGAGGAVNSDASPEGPVVTPAVDPAAQEPAAAEDPAPEEPAAQKPKRTRTPRRSSAAAGAPASRAAADTPAGAAEDAEVAPAATAAAQAAADDTVAAPDSAAAEAAGIAPAKAPRRRRATAKAASPKPAESSVQTDDAGAQEIDPAAVTAAAAADDTVAAPGSAAAEAAGLDADAPAAAAETEGPADGQAPDKPARTPRRRSAGTRARKDAAAAESPTAEAAAATAAQTSDAGTAAAGKQPEELQPEEAAAEAGSAPGFLDPFALPQDPTIPLFHAPDLTVVRTPADEAPDTEDDAEEDTSEAGRRRRRRRSRGRGEADTEAAAAADPADTGSGPEEGQDGVTSRRRRRRRRGEADLELTGGSDDDPPNTVTRVRAPRAHADAPATDRVTSVKGSTRLEAKKQRRRESRESGRRRHIITEAEFLARRESVDRQMVVRQRGDRIQIGVLEDGVLAEHFVSNTQQDSLIGNVYVGKVQNVLPSMEAAFVDIGRGRNAVLYAGEVNWDAAGLDGQPRRIELALKSGDSVLVQVTKDPVGHKGARLTSQISLPGRYLVYVPGGSMTGISRKLPDTERARLKKILKDHLPQNAGVIVRTAAEGASEEELMNDINRLRAQWEQIEAKSKSTKTLPPELLYGEPDLTIKVVRDVFNEDFSKLIVSGEEAWDTIEAYVTYVAPDLVDRLEKWTSEEDIFAVHRIDEQIAKALERKVFLPSGGSLVIDRTEAMTVVDVNTGKFTGSGGNLEETVTKNNLEAAEEVVRQLRLRDIGGIIVIDFIDMVLEANRDLVLRRLVECLGRDRTKHQVAEVTSLGLVQMTRKRMGTGLLEVFGETCEHCDGRGVVTQDVPVEHRRHAVSEDNHQHHLKQEKQSRGDRRRKGRKDPAPAPVQPVQAEAELKAEAEDPEAKAKAAAARAALATIAAAAAAAHEPGQEHGSAEPSAEPASGQVQERNGADGNGDAERPEGRRERSRRGRRRDRDAAAPAAEAAAQEPASEAPAEPAGDEAPVAEGPVLRIQGETVVVPRRERRRRPPAEPALTLESLTEAFDVVAPRSGSEQPAAPAAGADDAAEAPAAGQPAAAGAVEPAAAEPAGSGSDGGTRPARRRRRAASSPQGSGDAARIETAAAEATGEGSRRVATAGKGAPASAAEPQKAAAPVILGVGVPASEL
ncbi:Ribonuclease G [Arthrobacter saudimassiliensis]|uniref:Ribonuclease E n=1 Tax=Arthrobacter saudimassiliensis TaxID=1461584 RepID=A0A078MU35_9MICC|nr:Ribonuclease G [Arthrobacter saudimassiliensis]